MKQKTIYLLLLCLVCTCLSRAQSRTDVRSSSTGKTVVTAKASQTTVVSSPGPHTPRMTKQQMEALEQRIADQITNNYSRTLTLSDAQKAKVNAIALEYARSINEQRTGKQCTAEVRRAAVDKRDLAMKSVLSSQQYALMNAPPKVAGSVSEKKITNENQKN